MPDTAEGVCLQAFAEVVLEGAPKIPRKTLIDRYGLSSPGPFDFAMHLHGVPGLEGSDLDRYEEEYRQFVSKSRQVARLLHKVLSQRGFTRQVDIDAGTCEDISARRRGEPRHRRQPFQSPW